MKAQSIDTIATVSFDKVDGGFSITDIHLDLTAKIPGGDKAKFDQAAANAKAGCPISKLFKGNANITLDAKLAG
jgi:osmotically inducible protein OsmC